MANRDMVQTYDPDADDRSERGTALDKFARGGEPRGGQVTIPPQAFSGSDRIVGAQEVAVRRDTSRVLADLKTLAAAAGSDWYYRFPVKNKKEGRTDWIEGPSIKLANDLARLYGNCDVDIRVQDLGDSWLIYARFTDFETGFSITRPFQQNKNASRMGGADDARRLDIALQIGVSKATRNVVTNALQTFSDYAFDEAKGAIIDKVGQNLERYRARVVERLKEVGVDLKRAEHVRGRAAADWLAGDVAQLIAMIKAVTDGMATWDETFPPLEKIAAEEKKEEAKPGAKLDEFAEGEKAKTETKDQGQAAAAAASDEGAGQAEGATAPSSPAPKPSPAPAQSKKAAAKPAAVGADPTKWSDEECAAFGREQHARGLLRRAAVPPELRDEKQDYRAELVLRAFDHAAAAANGQKELV